MTTRTRRVCFVLTTCCLMGLGLTVNGLGARGSDLGTTGCSELLQDGGFEAGGLGWLQYSAQGYELISDFNPRTGALGAYLAGVNNADDRVSQQVTLPSGTITLRAWWYLATAETAGAFDHMTVALLRSDGTWLADLTTVDNTAPVGVWDEIVIDLSSYAGRTVVLRFTGCTDDSNISDFYLDDVSVIACVADPPTATPTASRVAPTATPTATRTATSTATTVGRTPTATATPTATVVRGERRCYLPYALRKK
jgi:hypothetical protein